MDTETGASFEKGYYDENGQRYDDVTFEENGRYKNVVCHCPYCDQDTILELSAGDVTEHSMKCQHCGGPMEIRSELDSLLGDTSGNTHVYRSEESLRNAFPKKEEKKKKKKHLWLIVAVLMLAFGLKNRVVESLEQSAPGGQTTVAENQGSTVTLGKTVYLERQAGGAYRVVTDVVRANKILTYDRNADSYYDESANCWAWYNTEVTPAVWQYWYEGISSDFGDYGWMEHDAKGWYIEKSNGNWIPVPDRYDTSKLWYIEQ